MRSIFEFCKVTFSAPNRFEPTSAEEKFLCDYAKRFLAHRRAMSILAVVYWSAFSLWDLAQAVQSDQFQHVVAYVLTLRLLGTLCLAGCAWLSFRKAFVNERYATVVLISMVGSAYFLLGLMLLLLPFPMNYIYYSPGHFMVLIFAHGMFRLRAKPALRLTVALVLFSEFIYAYMANDAVEQGQRLFSAYYFLFSSLYLTSFAVIGCAIVVELERTARDAYSRQRQLGISNQSILMKNAELEQLNAALEESKREMEAKTAALIAAKEEARDAAVLASRQKSKLLADASHDLRQPLQALGSMLEASQIALGRGDRETSSKLLSGAQTALRLARSSFNGILDISRFESGFVEPEYSSFPIAEFLTEILEPLRVMADEKGITLRMRFGAKKSIVHSDQQLLSQVLTNLIGNAIKYSDAYKPNPAILIGIVGLPNRARIDIVDNGIGIRREHWDDVFRPFFQIGNPERDREKGTGLGLSIVKSIVDLLKEHRVEMRSVEGRGTRFSLEIPLAGEAAIPLKPKEPAQLAVLEEVEGLYVLYVEDDALVRASTDALLKEYGILCEAVGSMEELKELLPSMERIPDVLITDRRLPRGWTARDIVDVVSAHIQGEVPVIVMTGDVKTSAAELPKARLLAKPAAPEDLLAAIVASWRRGRATA